MRSRSGTTGRSSSSPSPLGEAAATTCPGGRRCTTSCTATDSPSSRSHSTTLPDDVRPFVDGITIPVLIDPDHLLTELYAISNVPTVIWIDEQDRIVRPNGVAFSSDMFKEFTGVAAGPHLDTVRSWVRSGDVPITPDDAREAVGDLSDDEIRARLHFRIAAHARRNGDDDTAQQHFAEAGAARAARLHDPSRCAPAHRWQSVRRRVHGALRGVAGGRKPLPRTARRDVVARDLDDYDSAWVVSTRRRMPSCQETWSESRGHSAG